MPHPVTKDFPTFSVFKRLLLVCTCLLVPLFTRAQATGFSEHTLLSAGAQRNYLLYIPEGYGNRALPMVFSFHGSGGVPQSQADTSRFDALADRHGFIAVFPAGAFTNSTTGGHTWPGAARNGAIQDINASELIWEFFSRHALDQ